jgi:hypothetical protein
VGDSIVNEQAKGSVHTRRWIAQRWLIDHVIRSVGIDWDQPRSINYNAPCGPEANADFAVIRERVKKYADISPAFETAARRREAKVHVSMPNWIEAGRAIMDWMRARDEVDPERIAVVGQSFGSFFGTIACANDTRYKACAVSATCLEPGFHTIFEEASPTFPLLASTAAF